MKVSNNGIDALKDITRVNKDFTFAIKGLYFTILAGTFKATYRGCAYGHYFITTCTSCFNRLSNFFTDLDVLRVHVMLFDIFYLYWLKSTCTYMQSNKSKVNARSEERRVG